MKKLLLIVLLTAVNLSFSNGQTVQPKKTSHRFSLGPGIYSSVNNDWRAGLVVNASYSLKRNLLYKIKYTFGDEIDFLQRGQTFHEVGLLAGHGFKKQHFDILFSGGPGWIFFNNPETVYEESVTTLFGVERHTIKPIEIRKKYDRPSILLESDFLYKASRNFGCGASLGFNINSKEPVCYFLVKMVVGRFDGL